MRYKALIISLKGTKLSKREKNLLSIEKPWGVILFRRNLKSLPQIRKLTNDIKNLTKNKNFPIIIDEEGKDVSRLRDVITHNITSNFFGDLLKVNEKFCLKLLQHYINSLIDIDVK